MTAKQINLVVKLNVKHVLYRSDGQWYHHLNEFPGALFDRNGYVIIYDTDEYLKHPKLQHGDALHVLGGISSLEGYISYTNEQRKQLRFEKGIKKSNNDNKVATLDEEATESRLARICWNDNGWTMPSGLYGKSNSLNLHEGRFGYGHEEWLLDIGKLLEKYHYAFLEPVRKYQATYAGRKFNVLLYAIHGETGKRFVIGVIHKLEVLDKNKSELILSAYKKKGWIVEMEEQIKVSGANANGLSNWKGVDLFNIRFLPNNLHLFDSYIEVPNGHYLYSQTRYSFTHYDYDFELFNGSAINFSFVENNDLGDSSESKGKSSYIRVPKMIELTFLHNEIRDRLTKYLQLIYGTKNVKPEHPAGYEGNKIDIVANDNGSYIYYEIKTYPALKTSIREALGQLIEYGHWINEIRAKELIIITHIAANEEVKVYFRFLRETYKLNLYYQSFDIDSNTLSDKC